MTIVWTDELTELDAENMNQLEQIGRKGMPNGYAALGADGIVPAAQLPPLVLTDADIPASITRDAEMAAALVAYQALAQKGQLNGYAGLDATGKVPAAQLPPLVITDADIPASITRDDELTAAVANKVSIDSNVPTGSYLLDNRTLGDAQPLFNLSGAGSMFWGRGGATPPDVTLYRNAADNSLRLDVPGGVRASHGLSAAAITAAQAITAYSGVPYATTLGFIGGGKSAVLFGSLNDASIYREGAGLLKTDAFFQAATLRSAADVIGNYGLATQITLCDVGGGKAGILFGNAADTLLYRNGAGVLRANGTLDANQLTINGVPVGGAVDVSGKVDKDSVVVAATRVVANKLAAGDAQPTFQILGDGKHQWGPGNAALDTSLFRAAAATLQVNDALIVNQSVTAGGAVSAQGFNSALGAAGQIAVGTDGSIYFGSDYGLRFYRSGGAMLTNGDFGAVADLYGRRGAASQVVIAPVGGNAGMYFGSALDTTLYRVAAGALKTNGGIDATRFDASAEGRFAYGQDHETRLGWPGINFGPYPGDTQLQRLSATILLATTHLFARGQLMVGHETPSSPLVFGQGYDATIYRSAASTLRTDADFQFMRDTGVASDTPIGVQISGLGARRVVVGGPDSGGAGFRILRVTN